MHTLSARIGRAAPRLSSLRPCNASPRIDGADDRPGSERETLPPAPPSERGPFGPPMVQRIQLAPTVDEVLYRLSVGDDAGAREAAGELGGLIPSMRAGAVVLSVLALGPLEELMLACVDDTSSWGNIMLRAPMLEGDALRALCQIVEKGAVFLAPPREVMADTRHAAVA